MITKVFALRDVKAESFGVPFFMQATGLAVRAFTDLVNDPKSAPSRYPDDFVLYELGEFDDNAGKFVLKEPVALGHGSSFVNKTRVVQPEVVSQLNGAR